MTDWLEQLSPEERTAWDEFVDAFRRDALEKIAGSATFVSLVPSGVAADVKFCAELGTAIMLDKPILAVARPGVELPAKLRAVADEIVSVDLDLESGQQALGKAVARFLLKHARGADVTRETM